MPADSHDLSPAQSLFAGLLAELDSGRAVDFAAFCAAHPEHAPELESLWQQHLDAARMRAAALHEPVTLRRLRVLPAGGDGSASAEPASELVQRLVTRKLGAHRYRDGGELGRGGMGAVLRVWDEDLRRELAMKVARDDAGASELDPRVLARFLEEAQVTGQLEHPGIIPVHELGVDERGRVYYTMPLVRGRDLEAIFALVREEREGWSRTRALGVLQKVCDAMAYAHSRGVIHRDLKPANVMVGNFGEVYVMDWGLARVLDAGAARDADARANASAGRRALGALSVVRRDVAGVAEQLYTLDGDVLGTPEYMAPEQAAGRLGWLDGRTDVYALGAMLHHLLAGAAPYAEARASGGAVAVLEAVRAGPPRSLRALAPDAPAELVAICEQAMARERAQRYPDMRSLGEDLRAFLERRVVHAHDDSPWAYARQWVRRNPWLAGAAAAAVLAVGVAARVEFARQLDAAESARSQAELSERALQAQVAQRVSAELAGVRLASERGAWPEVLTAVERALEAGYPDTVDAECRRIEAHLALGDKDEAGRRLEALDARGELGAHRARALLLRATWLSNSWGRREECFEAARAALEAGLEPAEAAFARALVAPTTREALSELERVLELAPFHLRAHELRASLLTISGRFEQARRAAEQLRALYPRDTQPDVILSVASAMAGHSDEAAAARDRLRERLPPQLLAAHRAVWAIADWLHAVDVEAIVGEAPIPGLLLANSSVAGVSGSARPMQDGPGLLSLARLSEVFLDGAGLDRSEGLQRALPAIFLGARRDPGRFAQVFRAAREIHDDSAFYLLEGFCLIAAGYAPQDRHAVHMQVRELFRQGAESTSFAPAFVRAALFWTCRAEADLIASERRDEFRAPALSRCATYFGFGDPTLIESRYYSANARGLGDMDLALSIAHKTWRRFPHDHSVQLHYAEVLAWAARFDRALELCDALLALDPAAEPKKIRRRALEERQAEARVVRDFTLRQRAEWLRAAGAPSDSGAAPSEEDGPRER